MAPLDLHAHGQQWIVIVIILVAGMAAWGVGIRLGRPVPALDEKQADAVEYASAVARIYTGLAAWNLLSILWAGSRASALEAGGELLLYLATAWVIALLPWRGRSAAVLLGAWSLGVAVTCAGFLIAALGASDLTHYVFDARWQQPTGYANTAAALPAMAFWPALMLSARRRTARPLQVLFVVTAVFLLDFALLAQSRAMFVVMLLVLLVFLLWTSDRLRVLTRALAIAAASALALDPVFGVIRAADGHHPVAPAIEHAARWIVVSLAAAVVIGIALVAVESRYRPSPGTVRIARLGGRAVAVALLGALLGLAAARGGSLPHYVSHQWRVFKARPANTGERASYTRLGTLTSDKRYDYWRVALDAFGDHPLADQELAQLADRRQPARTRCRRQPGLGQNAQVGADLGRPGGGKRCGPAL